MKKFIIIFVVIAVIIVIIGTVFLSIKEQKSTQKKTSVIPTQMLPSPTKLPDIAQNVRSLIISELPYEQTEFLVEYLPVVDKFYVTILEKPYDQNYRKALLWLTRKGVENPANNAKIEFVFTGYREY